MWFILNFIPDGWYKLFVHGVCGFGLVLTILATILRWRIYQIIGILVLMAGIFFEGGYATEMMWRAKVEEVQKKLDEANKKSEQVTAKLTKKLNAQTQLIKKKAKDNAIAIKKHAEKIDTDCNLNGIVVELHNRASNNEVSGTTEGNVGELPKPSTGFIEDFQIK